MKKTIITIFALFLLCATVMAAVAAPLMPHPVYGTITSEGLAVKGLEVNVELVERSQSQVVTTTASGNFQIDLANFVDAYWDGATIKVSLVYCAAQSNCIETESLTGGSTRVDFDISNIPETLPDDAVIVKIQCADGSLVGDVSDCPVEEPEETDATKIALGILSAILGIALIVIGKFKWGKGFVGLANYFKRKGDEALARGDKFTAKKNYERAAKMVSTAITRAKDGYYQ